MKSLDIEPNIHPIRGGTDGSQLSYMGLPTPNIFTGGENYHGKFEYVSVDTMEKPFKLLWKLQDVLRSKQKEPSSTNVLLGSFNIVLATNKKSHKTPN